MVLTDFFSILDCHKEDRDIVVPKFKLERACCANNHWIRMGLQEDPKYEEKSSEQYIRSLPYIIGYYQKLESEETITNYLKVRRNTPTAWSRNSHSATPIRHPAQPNRAWDEITRMPRKLYAGTPQYYDTQTKSLNMAIFQSFRNNFQKHWY